MILASGLAGSMMSILNPVNEEALSNPRVRQDGPADNAMIFWNCSHSVTDRLKRENEVDLRRVWHSEIFVSLDPIRRLGLVESQAG